MTLTYQSLFLPGERPMGATRSFLSIAVVRSSLLDHSIRTHKNRLWDREPECFCSFHADHQLEFGRLFNRQIGGLCALEYLVDIGRGAAPALGSARPVGHEAASVHVLRSSKHG